jgi:hypothetical protein
MKVKEFVKDKEKELISMISPEESQEGSFEQESFTRKIQKIVKLLPGLFVRFTIFFFLLLLLLNGVQFWIKMPSKSTHLPHLANSIACVFCIIVILVIDKYSREEKKIN